MLARSTVSEIGDADFDFLPRMCEAQEVNRACLLIGTPLVGTKDQRRDQRFLMRHQPVACMLVVDGRCANTPRPVRTPEMTRSRT